MTPEEMKNEMNRAREKEAKDTSVNQNEKANQPLATGAPLEGGTRENAALRNTDNAAGTTTPEPNAGAVSGEPVKIGERDRNLADQAAREGKDALTAMTGGKATEGNKAVAKSILGENVVEDKNSESIKADLSSTIASPGVAPAGSLDPSRTIQREDGTITTADRPQETAHYIHGSRVMITAEQKSKVDALTNEINELQDGRGIGDIPVSDVYWEKRKELDAFVARLKR
jgi:hypothetical protein